MTDFLLIRHASHDLLGKGLAGRAEVHVNAKGVNEARLLAARLRHCPLGAIYVSPRHRCWETAAPLAAAKSLPLQVHEKIDEINFGDWTHRTFAELEGEPEWKVWNTNRIAARIPGGETIEEVQSRTLSAMRELASQHENATIAVFSHCDVIKAAVAGILSLSLDELERFEIAPASVSRIRLSGPWAKVYSLNEVDASQ